MTETLTGLPLALFHLRSGQPALAEQACRQCLALEPANAEALELLSVLAFERGDAAMARDAAQRAVLADASRPAAHFFHGKASLALGRPKDALASFERTLQIAPAMPDALHARGDALMAMAQPHRAVEAYQAALAADQDRAHSALRLAEALLQGGRFAHAVEACDWMLARWPADAAAWMLRGNALYAAGDFEQAARSYGAAGDAAPDMAEAHDNRGLALAALGRAGDAVDAHARAIAARPGFALAHMRRALALRMLGRFAEAMEDADRAVTLDPQSALAWNARGIAWNDLGEHERAVDDYQRALELDPRFAEAWNNAGDAFQALGRHGKALAQFEQALAIRPGYAEAHSNRGLSLHELGRFSEAHAAFNAALAADPGHPEARKRRAQLRLLLGDAAGWEDYAASIAGRGDSGAIPLWQGEPLAGKALLLDEPNGFGDLFQYWRLLPGLIAQCAQVAFQGNPRLFKLLQSSGYPIRYIGEDEPIEGFDMRSPLWRLQALLRPAPADLAAAVPYLHADPALAARWRLRLDPGKFKVGIAWQGREDRRIDGGRSIPLREFVALGRVPGVQLVSLQRGPALSQLADLPDDVHVFDPGAGFDARGDAFLDTAAMIAGLDLVVSSETSVAHLAGAMGRETWLALKRVPEWRWQLDRPDTDWYPAMRLFRQSQRGDWTAVFEEMRAALQARA
ncbi:MAG: tetratricopeptide repeat protein [Xanthomonadales bacterium]|nr:tetratricopeptide repeat protein [Xanthomonadales bacterium]